MVLSMLQMQWSRMNPMQASNGAQPQASKRKKIYQKKNCFKHFVSHGPENIKRNAQLIIYMFESI
jgi:hypothetical protein